MCGIVGIIAADRLRDSERRALGGMMERLVHRGPDDAGRHDHDRAALGHRRLSVIDPAGGRQPLSNESGSIWAVVNGEFYNFRELRSELSRRGHRLRGAGDAECLPHLYEDAGPAALDSLIGMFAFAVWDERDGSALLARDRLGVKPLYYHVDHRRLVFGSELKAVLAAPDIPTEIDPSSLIDFMTYGFIPAPKTIFRDIRKLPAGHCLSYRDGRATTRPYWDLHFADWSNAPDDQLAEQLWDRLETSTRCRLIADVPIGAFLSGGLDSTAVVTAASRLSDRPSVTVTCGFDEGRFDERSYAREVAAALGTIHHDGAIRPDADEILDALPWHFDEPFADSSAAPMYYLSRLGRRHFTVALSGDGGDEILAGYRRYRFDRREESVRRLAPAVLRRGLFGSLAAIYPSRPWMPRFLRAGATFRNLAVDAASAHALSIATMAPDEVVGLLHPDLTNAARDYDPLDHARTHYRRCNAPDHLSKCQYVDIRLGLADGILTKVDRSSMAHGLEVRSPMLDHRLIEFAWTIPPGRRIRRGTGKTLLRRALRRRLGDRFVDRPKAGFDVPMDAWFRGPLRERFQDEVLGPNAASAEWLWQPAVRQLLQNHLAHRRDAGAVLWKLTMLERWARLFATGARTGADSPAERSNACTPPLCDD